MNDYFKYLTNNPEDKNWGLYLTVAGSASLSPGSSYPPLGHPKGYHFSWKKGRILREYQINYITDGEGFMETKQGKYHIKPGMILLLRPEMWHRYRPEEKKGWTEHYIGFKGEFASQLIEKNPLLSKEHIFDIGFHEDILGKFDEIINYVQEEKPGYQQIASGIVIQILGKIISITRNKSFNDSPIESLIQNSCLIIRDNIYKTLNIEELAQSMGINYSLFRKAFKKYTGLSPNQYHLALRIRQSSYQLINSNDSIKEISFRLGFCSVFYFSKLFKTKTGYSPCEFRKMYLTEKPS